MYRFTVAHRLAALGRCAAPTLIPPRVCASTHQGVKQISTLVRKSLRDEHADQLDIRMRTTYAPPMSISAAIRRELLHSGASCAFCKATDKLTIDHIHPRNAGGTDERSNLQVLCGSCNTSKGGAYGLGLVKCVECKRMFKPVRSLWCWQHLDPKSPAEALAHVWGTSTEEAINRAVAASMRREQTHAGQ